jgi:hypothetical protein
MIDDPIVREIHETRRRMFEECGGDVEQLIARLKEDELNDKDRLVTLDQVQKRARAPDATL